MNNKNLSLKIISQSFYPDFVATGELLYELASVLVNKYKMNVSVITAQPTFVKKMTLPSKEICNGINIKRIKIFNFDKNSLLGKVFNSHSFFYFVIHYLNWSKKVDWLLIPTSPPLLPLIGYYTKLLKGQKYIFLMHDVYPEIAVKLGYIKDQGIIYKLWDVLTKLALQKADLIIVLSEDMKKGLIRWVKNIDEKKIHVIHNWANEDNIKVIPTESNHFIDKFNLKGKFIVEYSGNIGRIHEFKTIIECAKLLKDQKDIFFLFIGDGGKKPDVVSLVEEYLLENVLFLPYQAREDLSYSLGMANIHILSLQHGYEHLAAPSKLYGILASGRPVIFVGNKNCYISKILQENNCGYSVDVNESEKMKEIILNLKDNSELINKLGYNSRKAFDEKFSLNLIAKEYYNLL